MPKFRKKPVIIEAIQWTGKNYADVMDFTKESPEIHKPVDGRLFLIPTLEGNMMASVGDWIIKGSSSERGVHFWPVKPDYFEENYENAE